MGSWQLQDAKAKLSKVIATARRSGPQVITQRGVETAVIVPFEDWQRLQAKTQARTAPGAGTPLTKEERAKSESFLKLLQSGPEFRIPDRHEMRMRKPFRF
jgi:prevent-host-death family protein